jgi:hypothetical protein
MIYIKKIIALNFLMEQLTKKKFDITLKSVNIKNDWGEIIFGAAGRTRTVTPCGGRF